ncbi:hypothetical protein QCA50_014367 [Cerrena zonata]|uniref:Uncharacterized protein n=1 Tax=Cerrena zonata TaxID=2478898 RepID=A0AAW0FR69_9APHY
MKWATAQIVATEHANLVFHIIYEVHATVQIATLVTNIARTNLPITSVTVAQVPHTSATVIPMLALVELMVRTLMNLNQGLVGTAEKKRNCSRNCIVP